MARVRRREGSLTPPLHERTTVALLLGPPNPRGGGTSHSEHLPQPREPVTPARPWVPALERVAWPPPSRGGGTPETPARHCSSKPLVGSWPCDRCRHTHSALRWLRRAPSRRRSGVDEDARWNSLFLRTVGAYVSHECMHRTESQTRLARANSRCSYHGCGGAACYGTSSPDASQLAFSAR
jgi:hypothetical protein